MLNGSRFASPLRSRHVLFQFLFGQIVNAIALFGLAYLFLKFGWPNTIWAEGIAAVLGFLFLAFLVISLLSLPRAWQLQWSARKEVRKLIKTMDKVYRELSADGPISGRHIHEEVRRASHVGVVWPAPLFALLDDINARTGRYYRGALAARPGLFFGY